MADHQDKVLRFLNDQDYRAPGFSSSREDRLPIHHVSDPIHHSRQYVYPTPIRSVSDASTASTASARSYESSCSQRSRVSRTSSVSTSASSVDAGPVPIYHPVAAIHSAPQNHGYDLPCFFQFINCNEVFSPDDIHNWVEHSFSHFINTTPPPKSLCVFCDRVFDVRRDRNESWKHRMLHIAGHLQDRRRPSENRPDFFLLDHMLQEGLLEQEVYDEVVKYSERPPCDGLVDRSFEIPERVKERLAKERMRGSLHDLRKERRELGKMKDRRKGKHHT